MKLVGNRCPYATLNFLPFALFVFLVNGSQVAGQTVATDDARQIEIALKPDKETIMLNEPTSLSFEIKNYLSQDLCLGVGGDYRNTLGRPASFKVIVTRDDGRAVPQPKAEGWGGFSGCALIPANGTHTIKLFLPHWATFDDTGSYTIIVKRRMAFFNYKPTPKVFPDPDIILQAEVSANIKVVPYDENKIGEVIKFLGNSMLDINDPEARDSAQALAYIDDKRTIKYFAQALEKFGAFEFGFGDEYPISSQAVAALSRFNDDSAIAALEAAMDSPSEDTRLNVAGAFERSPHQHALELLLRMQNDSYWFVRLRVAQGLSRTTSYESLPVLRQMLKDENEYVREAARESLKTRKQK